MVHYPIRLKAHHFVEIGSNKQKKNAFHPLTSPYTAINMRPKHDSSVVQSVWTVNPGVCHWFGVQSEEPKFRLTLALKVLIQFRFNKVSVKIFPDAYSVFSPHPVNFQVRFGVRIGSILEATPNVF